MDAKALTFKMTLTHTLVAFSHSKILIPTLAGNQILWVINDHHQIQSHLPEYMEELNNQASEKQPVLQVAMTRDLNATSI